MVMTLALALELNIKSTCFTYSHRIFWPSNWAKAVGKQEEKNVWSLQELPPHKDHYSIYQVSVKGDV